MPSAKYTKPLNQLLQLGNPDAIPDWSAYLKLGISAAQIADLSRMAVDLDWSKIVSPVSSRHFIENKSHLE